VEAARTVPVSRVGAAWEAATGDGSFGKLCAEFLEVCIQHEAFDLAVASAGAVPTYERSRLFRNLLRHRQWTAAFRMIDVVGESDRGQ
jgi:hypothetical protein